ncbi:D-2-hydroxyacid dehydrogenase [Brevibacterium daeguense]|uniref:D-2-hydroxyacid dehydrogenase n=1 Tax=Brevibacterium daeguense TaxID=909936 RepID=UPI001F3EBA1C
MTAPELAEALVGADALLMWDFFSTALEDAFDSAGDLRWIHAASAGVDTLMFPALRESDIVLTNARGIFDRPIAEFVLAFILLFAKDMPESLELQAQRTWHRRETENIAGTRALVVGTGSIGREIARLLVAVGIEVRGAGSYARSNDPVFGDITDSAQLASHVADVDWLINVTPLTPATTGLIDAEVLAALPTSARLINVGRGASVITEDLVAALRSGEIAGAGLDVVDPEPLPAGHPLWECPGAVVTAHMSGDTHGWTDRLADQFMDNWDRFLADEPLLNVVDLSRGYVRS